MLLATPRGQGRGRTVIPGFAVRYISIMLPSQTRHLMCQSKTVVLPCKIKRASDLPRSLFFYICGGGRSALYDRRRVTREEGTTSFSLALLNFPFLIESSKPLHYWYRGQVEGCFLYMFKQRTDLLSCKQPCLYNRILLTKVVLLKVNKQPVPFHRASCFLYLACR